MISISASFFFFLSNSIFKRDILILTDGTFVGRVVRVVALLGSRAKRMIGT